MELNLRVPESRAPPDLTEYLVEEILVRVDAPADLARASAACKAFRRLISDPTFLRRYRTLHTRQLLGFIDPGSAVSFFPAEAPHPNAAAARAFAGASCFSFSHLPYRRAGWRGCDARDGRIILKNSDPERGLVLPELAVCECDPFTQVYTLLPPISDGLLASVLGQLQDENIYLSDAFFDPSGGYEEAHFSLGFSVSLPYDYENRKIVVVETGEGRVGMFSLYQRPKSHEKKSPAKPFSGSLQKQGYSLI